jgi:hypothetical protein
MFLFACLPGGGFPPPQPCKPVKLAARNYRCVTCSERLFLRYNVSRLQTRVFVSLPAKCSLCCRLSFEETKDYSCVCENGHKIYMDNVPFCLLDQ